MPSRALLAVFLLACQAFAQGAQIAEDEDYGRPPRTFGSDGVVDDQLRRLERSTEITIREWVLLLMQRERESTELLIGRERDALLAFERFVGAQFLSQERALQVASEALTIRLDHSNGLIADAKEKEREFASSDEISSFFESFERRLAQMEQYRATLEGERAGSQPMTTILIGLVAAVGTGLVAIVLMRLFPTATYRPSTRSKASA